MNNTVIRMRARQTDRQMEIKTDRRTDRWNYRQTDREVIGGRMSEFKQ